MHLIAISQNDRHQDDEPKGDVDVSLRSQSLVLMFHLVLQPRQFPPCCRKCACLPSVSFRMTMLRRLYVGVRKCSWKRKRGKQVRAVDREERSKKM
eukprot:767147-Hanusia_phi.AAC.2